MLAVQSTPTVALDAHDAPLHIGAVTLRVNDLARLTTFYSDAIGLGLIASL